MVVYVRAINMYKCTYVRARGCKHLFIYTYIIRICIRIYMQIIHTKLCARVAAHKRARPYVYVYVDTWTGRCVNG